MARATRRAAGCTAHEVDDHGVPVENPLATSSSGRLPQEAAPTARPRRFAHGCSPPAGSYCRSHAGGCGALPHRLFGYVLQIGLAVRAQAQPQGAVVVVDPRRPGPWRCRRGSTAGAATAAQGVARYARAGAAGGVAGPDSRPRCASPRAVREPGSAMSRSRIAAANEASPLGGRRVEASGPWARGAARLRCIGPERLPAWDAPGRACRGAARGRCRDAHPANSPWPPIWVTATSCSSTGCRRRPVVE